MKELKQLIRFLKADARGSRRGERAEAKRGNYEHALMHRNTADYASWLAEVLQDVTDGKREMLK